MILARNGRYDEAKAAVHRALKIEPNFKPAAELSQQLPKDH
jgi:hypothetical protein